MGDIECQRDPVPELGNGWFRVEQPPADNRLRSRGHPHQPQIHNAQEEEEPMTFTEFKYIGGKRQALGCRER